MFMYAFVFQRVIGARDVNNYILLKRSAYTDCPISQFFTLIDI